MKLFHFLSLLLGISLILGVNPVAAQDAGATSAGTNTDQSGGTNGATGATAGEGRGRIFAQLNLTDEQKAQIKQIRASTTDKKTRHQEILAILTPEQKEQLKQIIQQRRAQHQAAAGQGNT